MKRLVLIDGTNFFFRGSFAGELSVNGKNVKYIYAFFRNMISLIKRFEKDDDQVLFVCCWDGGYDERLRISEQAVKDGLIQKSYKQERREARQNVTQEQRQESLQFLSQLAQVQQVFKNTRVRQIRIEGQEADDLIGSLVFSQKGNFDEVIVVTSDRDYYQLLEENVKIYNAQKKEFFDRDFLKREYGLTENSQWIDVGALAGERGVGSDTIYGVPGFGYLTASKYISKYGSIDNLAVECKKMFEKQIQDCGDIERFKESVKNGSLVIKKNKKELQVILNERVMRLAYTLKQMRTWIKVDLPDNSADWKALDAYIHQYHFSIGAEDFDRLVIERKIPEKSPKNLVQNGLF